MIASDQSPFLRAATPRDIDGLQILENSCFDSDRLSRRSFQHFINSAHAELIVAAQNDFLLGYALVLYRRGTSMARLYSLAVSSSARGKGIGHALLLDAETKAMGHDRHFLRLEVNCHNQAAIGLYRHHGFYTIAELPQYYEDGSDGVRMEKALERPAPTYPPRPYYAQTTPFTCGPASLMMAMKSLRPKHVLSRTEELQLWREATTIYMTSGHGGCSGAGLALAASRRGFKVTLYETANDTPFIEGVRQEEKKSVLRLVHDTFCQQLKEAGIPVIATAIDAVTLKQKISQGAVAVTLVSTWRLNRNKAPHWVMIGHADQEHLYLNDPDFDRERRLSMADLVHIPVTLEEFRAISQFGRQRLQSTLLLFPESRT